MSDELERLRETWETWARQDRQFAIIGSKDVRTWDESQFMSYTPELDRAIELAAGVRSFRFERALDFGCGVGRLTQPLAGRFESVVGLDISSEMIANAVRLNRFDNCQYVVGTLDQLPSHEFDFVLSMYVIQHIPTTLQAKTLRALLRVLKPDGVAVAMIYNSAGVRGMLRRLAPDSVKQWRWRQRFPSLPIMEMNPLSRRQVEKIIAPARVVAKRDQWYVLAKN